MLKKGGGNMFNLEKIEAVSKKNDELRERIEILEDANRVLKQEVENTLQKANNELERRLIEFHGEVTERYFDTLEKIFRLNKEISLINTLAGQVKDKDFADLKAQMLQPLLEARWKDKEKSDGEKIVNKGQHIILERKKLHDEMLLEEKQGKDVKDKKEQLKAFDKILEMIKDD
jgi:hypothetical protein